VVRFFCNGRFGFLLLVNLRLLLGALVLGILFCIGYTCYYWACIRCALFSVDSLGCIGRVLGNRVSFCFLAYWAWLRCFLFIIGHSIWVDNSMGLWIFVSSVVSQLIIPGKFVEGLWSQ
jgi:hypothetical protein